MVPHQGQASQVGVKDTQPDQIITVSETPGGTRIFTCRELLERHLARRYLR